MHSLTFFIADDHDLMLKTISRFVQQKGGTVLGTADNGITAYERIVELMPDIALIDNMMPGYSGMEVAKLCAQAGSSTQIVLLTFDSKINTEEQLKDLHLSGYLLKETLLQEFDNCLEVIRQQGYYLPQKIRDQNQQQHTGLTTSEKKILKLIAQHDSITSWHQNLFISEQQRDDLLKGLVSKLQLPSASALLDWVRTNPDIG